MFDESKHPREKNGKFTDGSGTYDSKDDFSTLKKRVQGATVGKDAKSKAAPEDKTTIKEQIRAGMAKLEQTEVISSIPTDKIPKDFKTAVEDLRKQLDKNGGFVKRDGFGDIQVGERLKSAEKYIKTTAEVTAVSAVPSIIQKGILIDEHKNHKGRGFPSYLFAGKVSIGGKEGIVAVVVKKTTGNFYKVHRVLTPDGKDFKIDEAD